MTASRHPRRNAAHYVDTPGPLPSSGDVHAPPDAAPAHPAAWPPGGTDDLSHEPGHLVSEIDHIFGFTRRRDSSSARSGERAGSGGAHLARSRFIREHDRRPQPQAAVGVARRDVGR